MHDWADELKMAQGVVKPDIWSTACQCTQIKVLCEQTRELTHDFLDYV